MRKLILTPLLALACGAANSQGQQDPGQQQAWRQIVSGATSTAYADIDSIRNNGTLATMRVLIDYPKPPFDGNNLPYRSLTMRNEYDCGGKRLRVLAITSHTGNMARGERPYTTSEPGEWEAVSGQTVQQRLWELACAPSAARQ